MAIGQWSIARYGTVVIWPANGVLLAALLQLRRRQAALTLGVCFAINLIGNDLRSDPAPMLWLNAILNFGEVLVAGAVARRVCGAALDMRRPARLWRFAFLAVAPAVAASAVIGVSALHPTFWQIPVSLETWFAVETLGILIVTPSLLLLARGHRFALESEGNHRREQWMLIGALTLTCIAVFCQRAAPLEFLIFAPLLLIAFRLSPAWSAISVIIVAAVGSAFTLSGHGPMTLSTFGPTIWPRADLVPVLRALLVFHIFMATVLCVSLPASTVLTETRRLSARLKARTEAALKARQLAEDALGVKSRFLSMMSHEMRTPLNGVAGYAELLCARGDLASDVHEQASQIRRSSDHLLSLVEDILDFSRGDIEIASASFSLSMLLGELVDGLRPDAEAIGLTLFLSDTIGTGVQQIGDARRIRQILRQLLSNALKFTGAGKVDVHVEVTGQMTTVVISDSGPGLSPAVLETLFQPFSQNDATTSRQYEGAGLGLALSRRLATLMGGDLEGANQEGGGAIFTLRLPLEHIQQEVAAPMGVEGPTDRAPVILVVDDHATNRDVAKLMLDALGCQTTIACDGREAVEAARLNPYDLILMDVRMPNMDGLAATRAIRSLQGAAADVQIVAMTADAMPEDVARCLEAGMNGHLSKPISLGAIYRVLDGLVGGDSEDPACPATARQS